MRPIQRPVGTRDGSARSNARVAGNILMALGLGLLLFIGAAYGYGYLEDWLDAQQRYVTVASIDDWPLRPISPMLSLSPLQLSPTPTRAPVTATVAVTLPVRIVIPKINVNSRIVEVAPLADGSWGTAAWAVAYHKGTGKIGEADNLVLSGHNNFQGEVFRRLSELKAGDTIKLHTADREFRYVVTETAIIPWVGASAQDRRRHIQYLLPTTEPTLTLVSCWPYWVYTHRVYVVAKPVS
jgi:sortase A